MAQATADRTLSERGILVEMLDELIQAGLHKLLPIDRGVHLFPLFKQSVPEIAKLPAILKTRRAVRAPSLDASQIPRTIRASERISPEPAPSEALSPWGEKLRYWGP
jgi:hypothetical protein